MYQRDEKNPILHDRPAAQRIDKVSLFVYTTRAFTLREERWHFYYNGQIIIFELFLINIFFFSLQSIVMRAVAAAASPNYLFRSKQFFLYLHHQSVIARADTHSAHRSRVYIKLVFISSYSVYFRLRNVIFGSSARESRTWDCVSMNGVIKWFLL